jgi:hypothetical protein
MEKTKAHVAALKTCSRKPWYGFPSARPARPGTPPYYPAYRKMSPVTMGHAGLSEAPVEGRGSC